MGELVKLFINFIWNLINIPIYIDTWTVTIFSIGLFSASAGLIMTLIFVSLNTANTHLSQVRKSMSSKSAAKESKK